MEAASSEILYKQQSTVTAHLRLLILIPLLSTKSPAPFKGLRDSLPFTLCSR